MPETNPLAPGLHRGSGDMVRAPDWNSLVDGVDALSAATGDDLDAVRDEIAAIVLGPATVHAVPSDDLAAKVAALPAGGGQLALAAGIYDLAAPLTIRQRQQLTVAGAGPATVLRCATSESALVLDRCTDIELSGLRIEGGQATGADGAHLNGALQLVGSTDVTVRDCVLSCAASPVKTSSCLTAVAASVPGQRPSFGLRVRGCRFEVGARQVGLLVIDPSLVVVQDNWIRLAGAADANTYVAQGVVVAGTRIGTVRVLDNVIEGAVQGIHVGASRHRPPPRRPVFRPVRPGPTLPIVVPPIGPFLPPLRIPVVLAESVLLRGNTIRLFVPPAYQRERHAVFVGNAVSVQVLSTTATLSRGDITDATPTQVEAIRLYGHYGPFLVVRDSSLNGFAVGVRVTVMFVPSTATWLVAETFADGAATAVMAPEAVGQERNFPEPTTPPAGPPVSVVISPAVAVAAANPQQLTATVRDAAGIPVPGVVVRYSVSGATTVGEQVSLATDATGSAAVTYTAAVDVSGADTISAYVDLDGNAQRSPGDPFASASVVHAPTLSRLTLDPASANVTQSGPITFTVTAFGAGGAPLAGVDVTFSSMAGLTPPGGQTDTNGQFAVTTTFPEVGQFTLTAIGTVGAAGGLGGVSQQAIATVLVVPPAPPRVALAPGSLTVILGNPACLTATLLDAAGRPVPDEPVRFAVEGANQTDSELVSTADGTARFCYPTSVLGGDRVTATYFGNVPDPNNRPFAVATVSVIPLIRDRVPVPDLTDMTLAAATTQLKEARLVVGTVRTIGVGFRMPIVSRQDPPAGNLVVVGSAVSLVLVRERIRPVDPPIPPINPPHPPAGPLQ